MTEPTRRPRRTLVALTGAGLVAALTGGAVLLARQLATSPRRQAALSYDVVADMGKAGFRTVVWTATSAVEALELVSRIPADFGRVWAEGPDGRPLERP